MATKKLLGARIKELRKKRSLTQEKLSDLVGIDPKHLSRIEVGNSYPSLETLNKIRKALRVDLRDLFEFSHHADNPKEMKKSIQNLLNEAPSEELPIILKVIRAIVR